MARPDGLDRQVIEQAATAAGLSTALSRRGFLKLSFCTLAGLSGLGLGDVFGAAPPLIILDNAKGLLLADPSRCVGCGRCELACTEFNDGRAQPSLARIKVSRTINFGPAGLIDGTPRHGDGGDGLIIPGTCRQCPHPVPCATACPEGAIGLDATTGARVVDAGLCTGCRLCQRACPWDMVTFDDARSKATKCFLCHGRPKCVTACPSAALHYVPWRDLSREGGATRPALTVMTPETAKACLDCHIPGAAPSGAK